ncbi:hypothetical protein HPP92_017303, partial [Vanilla planifolia]
MGTLAGMTQTSPGRWSSPSRGRRPLLLRMEDQSNRKKCHPFVGHRPSLTFSGISQVTDSMIMRPLCLSISRRRSSSNFLVGISSPPSSLLDGIFPSRIACSSSTESLSSLLIWQNNLFM